ncbi:hypothetical protein PENANT_c026G04343 [Penicillium antarcticum]|uniref:Uncharacterized protein n=1 Tax=Penicillium antarcticum TaxID=416450 RepID=A0A1V6PXA5_9EURO|nr:hypothetical protein PENANT_c026G04343 [Penicillium antarcticum]
MPLQSLPMETVLGIAENLTKMKDINALVRTHPRLRDQLDYHLYKRDVKNHEGAAALWAAEKGQLATLRKSILAGAKIPKSDRFKTQVKSDSFVESLSPIPRYPKAHPITAAAIAGSKACLRLLIRYGVYPNFLDDHFVTPIQAAAAKGHTGVVEMLLANHPEVYKGSFTLRRTLKSAAKFGHLPVLKVLFAYLESRESGGDLPVALAAQIILFEALWHDKLDIARFAISKGADVNAKNAEAAMWFVTDVAPWERVSRERRVLRQEHKSKKLILGQHVFGWRQHACDIMDAAMTGCNFSLANLVIEAGYKGYNGQQGMTSIPAVMALSHYRALQVLISTGDRPRLWPNGNWGNSVDWSS